MPKSALTTYQMVVLGILVGAALAWAVCVVYGVYVLVVGCPV